MSGTTISIKLAGGIERTYKFQGSAGRLDFRGLYFKSKGRDAGTDSILNNAAQYYMDNKKHLMVVEDKTVFDKIISFLDRLNGNSDNDIEDKKTNKKITVIDDSDLEKAKNLEHMRPTEEEPYGRFRDENNFMLDYYN